VRPKGLCKLKIHLIGYRTRDLPFCSTVPYTLTKLAPPPPKKNTQIVEFLGNGSDDFYCISEAFGDISTDKAVYAVSSGNPKYLLFFFPPKTGFAGQTNSFVPSSAIDIGLPRAIDLVSKVTQRRSIFICEIVCNACIIFFIFYLCFFSIFAIFYYFSF
jgi:hypothetical protein